MNPLGPIDEGAMWIRCGATTALSLVESTLQTRGLTLGSQPRSIFEGTVGAWLEGPWAGRRAVAGRLETAVAGLGAELPDGSWFSSIPIPRTAAGPGLNHLFLGGGGRCGRIRYAWLKAELLPGRLAFVGMEGRTEDLCKLVFHGLLEEISPREVEWRVGTPSTATLSFDVGTADRQVAVEKLLARGKAMGARTWTIGNREQLSAVGEVERELSAHEWQELLPTLPEQSVIHFRRLARESVAAIGGANVLPEGDQRGGTRAEELLEQIAAALPR